MHDLKRSSMDLCSGKTQDNLSLQTGWVMGDVSSKLAEAEALRQALLWACEQRMERVIFKCDSFEVVNAVLRWVVDRTEWGIVLHDCYCLLQQSSSFSLAWIPRQVKQLAHLFARNFRIYDSSVVWSCIPTFAVGFVQDGLL